MLGFAIALTVLVNVYLLQRRFGPLERLVDQMERADLSRPGANLREFEPPAGPEEVARLHFAFRRMLERLEAERRRASSAALAAQEEERARVARDLHDEVNQSLTGLLLRLEATRRHAPPELADELAEVRAVANQAMEELLTLARQLRPTALDDLGLKAAVAGLAEETERQTGIADLLRGPRPARRGARRRPARPLPGRPGGALERDPPRGRRAQLSVSIGRDADGIALRVDDDGGGFTFEEREPADSGSAACASGRCW